MTTKQSAFYSDAKRYWQKVPPTVNGMLGGFEYISEEDVKGSTAFLLALKDVRPGLEFGRVLDCGAGIGRVTKNLLLPLFDTVDMVELNQDFLDQAPDYIGESFNRVGQRYCSGLQDFDPRREQYDIIWSQWVLGHLTEVHLVRFLKRCIVGLKPGGLLCIKENIAGTQKAEFDDEDSSYTRPRNQLVKLCTKAGLELIKEDVQANFPSHIFEVRMFAFQPKQEEEEEA